MKCGVDDKFDKLITKKSQISVLCLAKRLRKNGLKLNQCMFKKISMALIADLSN